MKHHLEQAFHCPHYQGHEEEEEGGKKRCFVALSM